MVARRVWPENLVVTLGQDLVFIEVERYACRDLCQCMHKKCTLDEEDRG